MLEDILKVLHDREIFFRFENDEEGYYLSIIDRQQYPRIWADNDKNCKTKIIAETIEHVIDKTVLAEKDWEERFFGKTIRELIIDCQRSKIIKF